jgi:hypothetical protein
MVKVPLASYSLSRDYFKLWELAHKNSIICILDFEPGKHECRDVAATYYNPSCIAECVAISSRGRCYLLAESVEEFTTICTAYNLEWLIPLQT